MIRLDVVWLVLLLYFLCGGRWCDAQAREFAHPGILHSRGDLERMKAAVAAGHEPIASGFEKFRSSPASKTSYRMRGPFPEVARSPNIRFSEYDSDANAAYQCAIMWYITGNPDYAEKSKEIIRAWAKTLETISGVDGILMAGLGPFKMVNAAEIIRHTDAGWTEADVALSERHFREVVYPVIATFGPFANGNWDTAAMKTMMAIAIYSEDREMLERVLRYYVAGHGNGRLGHYVINEAGQCQESGRDQGHTQLGLAHLGDCCEMAWNQGLDLYGYADNLLLKGFEYTAQYNLGEFVPFAETLDRTGKYHHTSIGAQGRGNLRAVFEQIYNHYVHRAGLSAPFTQQAAESIRPEGAGTPSADHVGFGTLLFTQVHPSDATDTLSVPASPAGLSVVGSDEEVELTWIAAVGARHYSIKRAVEGGDYETIAVEITTPSFADRTVETGRIHRYVVSAVNDAGESVDSQPFSLSAGLPVGWEYQDLGPVGLSGSVSYDGGTFTLEVAGNDLAGAVDQGGFLSQKLKGDGSITARFVPQPSSQFSEFGLMLRDGTAPGSGQVSLLVGFKSDAPDQRRAWRIGLSSRNGVAGSAPVRHAASNVGEPPVLHGRMMGELWMKLQRKGDAFTGSVSLNGIEWETVGVAELAMPFETLAGMAACSGLDKITTTIMFDQVTVATSGDLPER